MAYQATRQFTRRLQSKSPMPAVCFDMDGLIFNSEDLYDIACDRLLQVRGQRFSRELKLSMMGHKAPEAISVLLGRTGIDEPVEEVQSELEGYFLEVVSQSLSTMPGFLPLLELLETHNIPRAIATSALKHIAHPMLEQFDLSARFDFVLTGNDVTHGKPAPDIYLLASRKFGVSPSEMAVLEDSETGTKASTAAGALTIAVPNDHTRDCDFSHVDYVAQSLADPTLHQLLLGAQPLQSEKSAKFS